MKLNIVGTIFGTTGYASHTRGLVNALAKLHDVKLSTMLPHNWEREVNDEELKMIMKPDDKDRVNIIIDLPHNWEINLQKEKNIGFLVWEGDKIPISWINRIRDPRISQVWVASNHALDCIRNTFSEYFNNGKILKHELQMLMDKVKIVPHGVDLEIYNVQEKNKDIFTFLCNKGFRNELDRGGLQHAIKAFLQEFNKGEAKLVLKLNPAYAMPQEQLLQIINKYVAETKKKPEEVPDILAIYDNLSQKDLNKLYNQCDVFLSPTGGETFNLPCIEAMACEKPVITTNFGGQTDYVNNSNGWLIDYKLKEVKHELMYEGISWATISLEKLKSAMREALNGSETKLKGKEALKIAKQYTWDNSAKKATEYMQKLK